MLMRTISNTLVIFILNLLYLTGSAQEIDYKGLPEWAWKKEGITEYYLYTPSNLQPGEVYPIALFLHGCCGTNYTATLRNCVDPPVRMWHNFGENTQTVPTYIISPATSSGWTQHFANLKKVIDDLVANHQGDPKRIYVTGFSMGGGGTWEIISTYPNLFAAAIPMAMDFRGSYAVSKDIPIWAQRGSADSYPANVHTAVGEMRKLNGDLRGGLDWETGVNPRMTTFIGVDHGGTQWKAVTSNDLVGWALSKINDGNIYPNVYFSALQNGQTLANDTLPIEIWAHDNDGSIAKIDLFLNGIFQKSLTEAPYRDTLIVRNGENKLEAIAFDNLGKTSNSVIFVNTPDIPRVITTSLPVGKVGSLYNKRIYANGNGACSFKLQSGQLPLGLVLSDDGLISGIPMQTGDFLLKIQATDADKDIAYVDYSINILPKNANEVLITNVTTSTNSETILNKIRNGETPVISNVNEINFSSLGNYNGLTYIMLNENEAGNNSSSYLTFNVDEDVTVYVAYETKDRLFSSTIPSWLSSFEKETSQQIVAQYRYFDVYKKNYPAGTIVLPGADVSNNNVSTNYVVMVKKQGFDGVIVPVITSNTLPKGYIGHLYQDNLTTLGGNGKIKWTVQNGSLPKGLTLSSNGVLSGYPSEKGTFDFTVEAIDAFDNATQADLSLVIDTMAIQSVLLTVKDTAVLKNADEINVIINNVTNKVSETQDIELVATNGNDVLLSMQQPVKINDSTFTISLTPLSNQTGKSVITLQLTDNNNPVAHYNRTINTFNVNVIPFINNPPTCNVVTNLSVPKSFSRYYLNFDGVTDGENGDQTITIKAKTLNTSILTSVNAFYEAGESSGKIAFIPKAVGSDIITLTLTDNGDTFLGGSNTKTIDINVTVTPSTGVESASTDEILIYPNPATDYININNAEGKYSSITIQRTDGLVVLTKNIESGVVKLDVRNIRSGMYLVTLNGTSSRVCKLTISQ